MTSPEAGVDVTRAEGPWTHRQVHARGVSFHVAIAGDEVGRSTVILLHDFPLHWWSWREQLQTLDAAGYRVVAMDLRGMGASDLQPGTVELDDLAQDVIAVAKATGTSSYAVVGSGVGGSVAWMIAHLNPVGLQAVATICAPHPLARRPRASRFAFAAGRVDRELGVPFVRSRRLRDGSLVRSVLTTWAAPLAMPHMREIADQYAFPLRRVFAANAALETQKAARNPSGSARKALSGPIQVPVLSVRGGRDGRVPPTAYADDPRYAGRPITHVEITESGHFPNEESPDQLSSVLIDFLASTYPPKTKDTRP